MTAHFIAVTPDNTANSIILQQRGLRGMEFILARGDIEDNDGAHKSTLENPGQLLGSYFLDVSKLRPFIKMLQDYHDFVAQYHVFVETYLGWENKEFRESTLFAEYNKQAGGKFINMGMINCTLFMEDCEDNHEAADKIAEDWKKSFGDLQLWGVKLDPSSSAIWRKADDVATAVKFESWFYETYIGPTLAFLQQNA